MGQKALVKTTASVTMPDGTVIPLGEFKRFSGGELGGGGKKSTQGAGKTGVARGGRQTVGNVTIGREDDGSIDLKALSVVRLRARMTVTRTPLDDTLNPRSAAALVYTGLLQEVRPGDGDTEDEEDLDEFELVLLCDDQVS